MPIHTTIPGRILAGAAAASGVPGVSQAGQVLLADAGIRALQTRTPPGFDPTVEIGPIGPLSPNGTADGGLGPGARFRIDKCTGQLVLIKPRSRRKRLLTCQDKADIAFVTGTLGKGEMGKTAISSLLSRCG